MTINIGLDEYIDLVGGPAGARIVVHPPSIMPHPEEQGILAKPGELTSIGVVKVSSLSGCHATSSLKLAKPEKLTAAAVFI